MHVLDRALRWLLPVGAVAVLATVLLVGWFTQPDRFARNRSVSQPIPYSHALHAGTMKIPCLYCHAGAERSRVAGVPSVDVCMGCHAVTRTDRPAIQKLAEIQRTGGTLTWNRVHQMPDHVYFDHRPHVNAGVACQTCHGEVQTMSQMTLKMSMRMGNCLGCHRDPKAALPAGSPILHGPEHCNACHR
nr:cytochrome c3 family protein [uncultured Holophaga sp.]